MKKVSLVYISLSGNTESFVTRLKDYLLSQYEGIEVQKIHIKDLVKEGQDFYEMDHPYVAFLPTYLEGGNGVDNGDVEILTTPVGILSPMVTMLVSVLVWLVQEIVTLITNTA